MTQEQTNSCSGSEEQKQKTQSTNGSQQATPFNIGTFGVLFVFCIIILLTSSLYYNWPAVERILIDDKVFQNLCTKDEILNAIDGMFVCDKQRIEIGNLALVIFYSEFVAFAIGGILTDIVGVYLVLILGFMFGFTAFLILYFFHFSNGMIKLAFAHWGMFGGLVFITSIQFPRMFPKSKSLADGMIILFDNLSGLMTLVIHKIMKFFDLSYHEAFATYILWGVFPAFLLVMAFIPYKIMPKPYKNQVNSTDIFDFSIITKHYECFSSSAGDPNLWSNFIVFSIPVTCSIFYKKTFSTYFLKNQTLVRLFPIIMLFVFVPTIFIAALNQFMGVHITSTILYIFYIVSFVCFLYPTKQYGLLSIILFVISTSAAEQQTMTYISEQHPQNESTLLGISYAVDFIVGAILQRLFTCIFNRRPKAILFFIIPLFLICIGYSIYCYIKTCKNGQQAQGRTGSESKSPSFRALFTIIWIVPFVALCFNLLLNSLNRELKDKSDIQIKTGGLTDYQNQKVVTNSVAFHSFSFYYACNTFMIITSIFNFSRDMPVNERGFTYFILLLCFFVIPQILVGVHIKISEKSYVNITLIVFSLLIFKFIMYYFSNMDYKRSFIAFFSIFFILYGFVFFQFIYMLAYYNLQITYVDRCYKTSMLHWGSMVELFTLFRFLYHILSQYHKAYLILWIFNICVFICFVIALYLYLPYEMEAKFNFNSSNLPMPFFPEFESLRRKDFKDLIYSTTVSILISICNFGILINMEMNKKIVLLFFINTLIHRVSYINSSYGKYLPEDINKYLDPPLSGLCLTPFVLLFVAKYFLGDKIYKISLYSITVTINLIIIGLTSTLSWLSVQCELQKCCCTNGSEESCGCDTKCCCTCKPKPTDCICGNSMTTCCCCNVRLKNCSCISCNKQCKCYLSKCIDCVCRCLKKFITPGKCRYEGYRYPIIFLFYEYELKRVKEHFCYFYIGTSLGYLFLTIYMAI